jgi:hypothetical protein
MWGFYSATTRNLAILPDERPVQIAPFPKPTPDTTAGKGAAFATNPQSMKLS